MTNMGREIRLGTASLAGRPGDALVDLEKLNTRKYASKGGLAMLLCDYMLYVHCVLGLPLALSYPCCAASCAEAASHSHLRLCLRLCPHHLLLLVHPLHRTNTNTTPLSLSPLTCTTDTSSTTRAKRWRCAQRPPRSTSACPPLFLLLFFPLILLHFSSVSYSAPWSSANPLFSPLSITTQHNPPAHCRYKSWWWKARLGKCYFKLGMLRDAEKQYKSSLKTLPVVGTYLELVNVYMRLDLPLTALDLLEEAKAKFPLEPRLVVGIARIHEMLNDTDAAVAAYKQVLVLDASCVEAIACLGAHQFYTDQPEMAMRYYRRLLQMGVNNTELWNNIGLCCFYSAQYDMAVGCFDRALSLSGDEDMADVWYNIGHLGVALGDHGLAYQAFKVAVSVNPAHAEALNNLAILELRRYNNISESTRQLQALEQAKSFLGSATDHGSHLFEPAYNRALTAFYRQGDFAEAKEYTRKALESYPGHKDSQDLDKLLLGVLSSE